MTDEFAKNLAKKPVQVQKESYTPEYVRLNMDPIIQKVNKNDFLIGQKIKRSLSPPMESSPMGPLPSKSGSLNKEEAIVTGKWFEEMKDNPNTPIDYDSVIVPEKKESTFLEADGDFVDQENNSSESSESEDLYSELENLQSGTYCVFVCGVLVGVSLSRNDAELLIQKILSEDTPPFKDVNMDDIMLLKRLHFRVGVLSEE